MNGKTVECRICGKRFRMLTNSHLKKHGISPSEYSEMYPDAECCSSETRRKKSASNVRRYSDPAERERQRQVWGRKLAQDPDIRKEMSRIQKQYYRKHPEKAGRHSAFMKSYFRDEGNRQRHRETMAGVSQRPEMREKRRQANLRRYADPEARKKQRESWTPDLRKRVSEKIKAMWGDPFSVYCSQAFIDKLRENVLKGEDHPKWKGGRNGRRHDLEWEAIRHCVFYRDDYMCQICGNTEHLIAHHIVPVNVHRNDSPSNLVILCKGCHRSLHHSMKKEGLFVTENMHGN